MNTLSIPIDGQVLIDIAITGIDTSCRAFWAEIDRWPSAKMFDGYEERLKAGTLPYDETLFRLRDDEDGRGRYRRWHAITMDVLLAAAQRALVEYNHLFTWHVSKGQIDDIDYDGWGADAVLQFATLGEVVYG